MRMGEMRKASKETGLDPPKAKDLSVYTTSQDEKARQEKMVKTVKYYFSCYLVIILECQFKWWHLYTHTSEGVILQCCIADGCAGHTLQSGTSSLTDITPVSGKG
ncbi:hypothetical protein Pcinc_031172 [Petrolisthes cinctipes]|uniref:Uncharacterized protein n=1 Tax=Petrolisthes cinctipes TaxID=88211 RepID=A0AAE1EXQ7_PETCI|nr:hypothetical protein Pcinc_031172 [Petrolisthes cinctipes]